MTDEGNGNPGAPENQKRETTGLSGDVKWMMGVIVAAIIAIGIAAVAISVTVFQFSKIAADIRHHEHRTNVSISEFIQTVHTLVDGMRDDCRDQMHVVKDVLRELQAIRQRLNDGDEPNAALERDLGRELSNVEQAVTGLMLLHPVRTRDMNKILDEILDELQAIKRLLNGT